MCDLTHLAVIGYVRREDGSDWCYEGTAVCMQGSWYRVLHARIRHSVALRVTLVGMLAGSI